MNHPSDKIIEDYEALLNEFNIIRRKLDSKVQALLILSKELDQCRIERDQYRLMTDQLKDRYCGRRKSVDGKSVIQLLCDMKEQNKILQIEVDDLKQKLNDAQGDIKLLREQMARQRIGSFDEGIVTRHFPAHEREDLVKRLEALKIKNSMLERDLQLILDEKEELVTERDAYKQKVERLNHELNYVLKGDEKRIIDVDALVMENRYLQERLKQIQEEKSLYVQTLSKYKSILEKRRNQNALKLGANGSGGVIITHKQVQVMLQNTTLNQLPTTQATIADLRSLALALFESLNDKNIALTHQKKANKILGNRVTELENKLKKLDMKKIPFHDQLPYVRMLNEEDNLTSETVNVQCADVHLENVSTHNAKGVPKTDSHEGDVLENGCGFPQTCNTEQGHLPDERPVHSLSPDAESQMDAEDELPLCEVQESSSLKGEMLSVDSVKCLNDEENSEDLPPTLLKLVKEALENLEREETEEKEN